MTRTLESGTQMHKDTPYSNHLRPILNSLIFWNVANERTSERANEEADLELKQYFEFDLDQSIDPESGKDS